MQRNTLKGRETCIIQLELATAFFFLEIHKKRFQKNFASYLILHTTQTTCGPCLNHKYK